LFAATVYRAATLSITIDEAYTYTQFVSRPLAVALSEYDANNHFLYTLLAKGTTRVFGPGDLALRLPALAGAALFYAALYRLILRLTGATWWLPLGFALVGANTNITDLLPLARGYGLALALFTLGLSLLLDETPSRRLAGTALGLAVAANLTFLFPVAGLLGGVIWLDRRAAIPTVTSAIVVALILLIWPLWHAHRESFYFGTDTLAKSAFSLMGNMLARDWDNRSVPVIVASALMALTFGSTILAGLLTRARPLFLLAASIGLALALQMGAHYGAGLVYPYGRTGIAWILLFGVSLVALGSRFRAVALVALPAFYFYWRTWSTTATIEWAWDSGTRGVAESLAAQPRPGDRKIRLGATPLLQHTLNYYRLSRGWTWLDDVSAEGVRKGEFDYYAVIGEDREWAEKQGMKVLFDHPGSGSALVKP
jgi:hypothetical protein